MHMMSAMYRGVFNKWRNEVLELPPRSLMASPLMQSDGQPVPAMYCYSPHVLPRPDDWPRTTIVTGYWFLDRTSDWRPPTGLPEFLASGAPPVYVGFGSMAGRDPGRVTKIVLGALAKSGQRGVIASGWGGLKASKLPDEVFTIESAPHEWLLPRVAAVVHHGGAGTTAAGLHTGRPTVICPFFGDQPFWGRRVFELGLGPKPIPQKKLTVDNLASAIRAAVSEEAMRRGAADMGERIRAEDGVGRAVEFIEGIVASRRPARRER